MPFYGVILAYVFKRIPHIKSLDCWHTHRCRSFPCTQEPKYAMASKPIERRAYASLKWSTFPTLNYRCGSPIWIGIAALCQQGQSFKNTESCHGAEPKGFREAWVDHSTRHINGPLILTGLCLLPASFQDECTHGTPTYSTNSDSTPRIRILRLFLRLKNGSNIRWH